MSAAAYWFWFGLAWVFIIAVALSRWHAREHADQKATVKQLKKTKPHVGNEHYWDSQ